MPYPSKALQEYVLKSEIAGVLAGGGSIGPAGPAGATGPAGPPGASWAPVQSATAPAIVSTGTISTAGLTVSRVAPTIDVTGIILAAGTIAGQQVVVLNESNFSITFAAAGTSHVAGAQLRVLPAATQLPFVWNTVTGLWYSTSATVVIPPPGGGTFGSATFGANTFGG